MGIVVKVWHMKILVPSALSMSDFDADAKFPLLLYCIWLVPVAGSAFTVTVDPLVVVDILLPATIEPTADSVMLPPGTRGVALTDVVATTVFTNAVVAIVVLFVPALCVVVVGLPASGTDAGTDKE